MDIGLGLPSTIPGVEPATVLRWAIDAEARGFATVGVVDRLVYSNLDPMTMLAAAAVVTTRVRLVTGVLVSPIRSNFPAFAKQTATIDRLSGGRLVLGLGVGNREDDFSVAGLDFHRRGRSFVRPGALLLLVGWVGLTASAANASATPAQLSILATSPVLTFHMNGTATTVIEIQNPGLQVTVVSGPLQSVSVNAATRPHREEIASQIARPRPVPPVFRLRDGSPR